MTSFASKYNKVSFGIDTTNFGYVKLADIYNSKKEGGADVIHKIDGMFVHKSQLGDSPVIIDADNKRMVNLPSHTADTVREICADQQAVQEIIDGKVGYTIYEYESHGKKCYSIRFVDL